MLDASFLVHSARNLASAAQYRKGRAYSLAKAKDDPIDWRARESRKQADRQADTARKLLAMAKWYNEKARLYTKADNCLRQAQACEAIGQTILADMARDMARRLFDKVDSLPPPLA